MKNELKKWFTASVFTSIGIALGMLMGGNKKKAKPCRDCHEKDQQPKHKITVH